LVNDFKKFGFTGEEVDWVGTGTNGRSSKENNDVLDRFLCRGAYKKLKTPVLKCLIQVRVAAEGFNCIRANILVFLNALGGDSVLVVQMCGRAARRDYSVDSCHPGEKTDTDYCDIICSRDSPLLPYLIRMEREQHLLAGDVDHDFDAEQTELIEGVDSRSPILYSIPDLMIVDVHHVGTDVIYCDDYEIRKDEIFKQVQLLNPDVSLEKLEQDVANVINKMLSNRTPIGEGQHIVELHIKSEHEQLTESRQDLHKVIKQMAGNIVSLLYSSGDKVYQGVYGDVMVKINLHVKEVYGGKRDELTISQCKDARAYIQKINNTFTRSRKAEDVPSWAKL